MNVVDGIITRSAYIESPLCTAPEVARSTFVASRTTAMVDSNIVDINSAAIGKACAAEVGIDTYARFQGIRYIQMVGGMVVAAEETKRRRTPVVLGSAISKGDIATTSCCGP